MTEERIDALYRACVAAIGLEAWTPERIRAVRALVTPLEAVDGPRTPAAVLLLAAARCLIAEGASHETHAAVRAAVNVWRRPPGGGPVTAEESGAPWWKKGAMG